LDGCQSRQSDDCNLCCECGVVGKCCGCSLSLRVQVLVVKGYIKTNHAPGKPAPNVVELLEKLLEEARAGEIACFGVVTVSPANFVGTSFATDGVPYAHTLVAGSVYLQRRLEKHAGLE